MQNLRDCMQCHKVNGIIRTLHFEECIETNGMQICVAIGKYFIYKIPK